MKTEDFMSALGDINERYLTEMMKESAESGAEQSRTVPVITAPDGSEQQAVPVSVQHSSSGRIGSGIFRHLILAASAAACIGGVSLLVILGRQNSDDLFRDSEPVEVTEITATVTSTDPAAESAGFVTTYTTAVSIPETTASSKTTGQKAKQTTAETGQSVTQNQTAAETTARTVQTTSMRVTSAPANSRVTAVQENNVTVKLYDWVCEAEYRYGNLGTAGGILRISTRDGKTVYEDSYLTQFTLPDGEYHVDICVTDQPSKLMDPDSDYAAYVRSRHPDVTFTDQRGGIDFAVIDGKPDRELRFDFGPYDGMSNSVTVCCLDAIKLQPLAGVQFTLIEEPDSDAKVIGTGISGADGTYTFSGLLRAEALNDPPYLVRIDSVPAGFTGGYDAAVHTGPYLCGNETFIKYVFTQDSIPKNVSAVVYDAYDEGKVLGDIASYEVWRYDDVYIAGRESYCVYDSVLPSEKIALADGSYFAGIHWGEAEASGYMNAPYYQPDDALSTSSYVQFKVKDGKPDKEIAFYLEKIIHADDLEN